MQERLKGFHIHLEVTTLPVPENQAQNNYDFPLVTSYVKLQALLAPTPV